MAERGRAREPARDAEAMSRENTRAASATRCPSCQKPLAARDHAPFCSERCRLVDLGRWLGEEYAVAGDPVPLVDDGEA